MADCGRYWTVRSPEDAMQDINKRSMIWWMFMSSTVEASVFMGKSHPDTLHSIRNIEEISLKNRCSTYLKSWWSKNQMKFLECLKSVGKVLHGNSYLWSMTKKSSVSRGDLPTSIAHEENGIESLNWWWSNSEKADIQFFEQRVRCLGEHSKAKEGGKLSLHFCADGDAIETVFHTFISANQLSIYGTVSDLCEKYSICQTRTGRPVLTVQSDPLPEPARLLITIPAPSIEILAQENLLQKHKKWVEQLPQPDQLITVCIDAGFLKWVECGQYFMTNHTDEFLQIAEPVTCREYTLLWDDKSTDPKGWIQGNSKIDPVLEVTTNN